MSLKCPHCGSYNTEAVISNWVGRGVINTGRAALSVGAALVGGLFMKSGGASYLGSKVWKATAPSESFNGYRCCECGKEFSE